jgi:sorbitol-specific phosphotransferase system component IIC
MTKKSVERKEAWFRILVFIISGIILAAWSALVKILSIINWLIAVISGKRNKGLAMFCEYWNTEVYKFLKYMTFVTNARPFPFSKLGKMSKFER